MGHLSRTLRKQAAETLEITVGGQPLTVEAVTGGPEQRRGLMYRDELPEDEGMLFLYGTAQPLSFWMKNTAVPLSIAFLDEDLTINQISDLEPYSVASVTGFGAGALEVNRGWFRRHGVGIGDRLAPGGAMHER